MKQGFGIMLMLMLIVPYHVYTQPDEKIVFENNHDHQLYAAIIQPVKQIIDTLSADLRANNSGLKAIAHSTENNEVEYVPLEIMICALHELLMLLPPDTSSYQLIKEYYQQLLTHNEDVVFAENFLRGNGKKFNTLCVKGNACIGGNLVVCNTMCPDPEISCFGPQGATGNTGTTGVTGQTGFSGFTGNTGGLGLQGTTGDSGFTGADGNTGFTGFTGPQGAVGAAGATGFTGPTGQTGFTGFTGNSGAQGIPASLRAYAFLIATGVISVSGPTGVLLGAPIPFGTSEAIQSVNYTIGSSQVTIVNPGRYEVLYRVSAFLNVAPIQFGVYVNDTLLGGGLYNSGLDTFNFPFVNGQVIFNAQAGDVVTIRNVNSNNETYVISQTRRNTPPIWVNPAATLIIRQLD
ncbi:MAG: hypothetical protein ACOYT8_00100 [Candidatus Dependentiae bacterium]